MNLRDPGVRLVLASSSPRRRELLTTLGILFSVRPVEVDETLLDGEAPRDYVLRLARAKARARGEDGELVLGADTAVLVDSTVLGKPADRAEARQMLRTLSGREHTVLTGVALYEPASGRVAAAVESTRVRIAELSEEEITWYVTTQEPMDKAGAYAIQGLGALLVEAVYGNYTNVVGLPLPATYRLFAELGHDLRRLHPQHPPAEGAAAG